MKRAVVFLAALAVSICAPLAQADIQISFDAGGGPVICANNPVSSGPTSCSASFPGVTIDVLSASSNSPGTSSLAQQFGSTLVIKTTTDAAFTIWMSAQGFMAPTTPPPVNYSSNLSLTSTTGTGTVGLESCVDTANGLTPPTTPFCNAPAATLTNAALPYSGSGVAANNVATVIPTLTITPYALAQVLTFDLKAGSNLNVITSQILTPVPEPMSIALLGGVVLLVSRRLLKKRNQTGQI